MNIMDMKPQVSSDLIDSMVKGYEISQILFTAVNHDIFSLLGKPLTAEETADIINAEPVIMEKFLNALVALNLLVKEDGKYQNTKLSELFLVKESPFYQGHLIKLVENGYSGAASIDLQEAANNSRERNRAFESAFTENFILAMAEGAMRGNLQQTVSEVCRQPEFKRAKKLLDLGGGHGLYALAFVQQKPQLKAVVFDLPSVVNIAQEFIQEYSLENRVAAEAGNFNSDDLGEGYDIIFASDIFYRKKEAVRNVLQKIYRGLNPGGLVILKHWFLNEDGTGPLTVVLFDFKLSLRGNNHYIYTCPEFTTLLEESGFEVVQKKDISLPSKPSVIIMGRKAV